jgi:hypothetical protein
MMVHMMMEVHPSVLCETTPHRTSHQIMLMVVAKLISLARNLFCLLMKHSVVILARKILVETNLNRGTP